MSTWQSAGLAQPRRGGQGGGGGRRGALRRAGRAAEEEALQVVQEEDQDGAAPPPPAGLHPHPRKPQEGQHRQRQLKLNDLKKFCILCN